MSYTGSGTFAINSTGQPVVAGTVISSTVFNSLTADLGTGLSTAITKDGQTTTTARILFAAGISSTLATDASSISTGSILTLGGLGVTKAAWIGGLMNVAGAATFQSTIGITGALTATTINASGLVAMAAAATVGTTLGVTGTSTMAAINASGVVTIGPGSTLLTLNTASASAFATILGTPGGTVFTFQRNDEAGFGGRIGTGNSIYGPGAARSFGVDGFSEVNIGINGTRYVQLTSSALTVTPNASFSGTLGVTGAITGTTATLTSTVEAGLTISRSTDATCAIYLNRSGGANSWAMYRYGSSASDKFAIGRPGASEDFTITTAGIITMGAYGAGAATFSAAGVISSVSDETWKTKDGVPTNPDAMLQKLAPGYWYYNDEKKETFGKDRQLGFYAQNVNAAIGPEAAPEPEEGKPWGYYDRSVLAVAVMSLQSALTNIQTLTADFQSYKSSHP
jgi:hypothetical protein